MLALKSDSTVGLAVNCQLSRQRWGHSTPDWPCILRTTGIMSRVTKPYLVATATAAASYLYQDVEHTAGLTPLTEAFQHFVHVRLASLQPWCQKPC